MAEARAVVKLSADPSELKAGVVEAGQAVDQLEQKITRKVDSQFARGLAKELGEINARAKESVQSMKELSRSEGLNNIKEVAGNAAQAFASMSSALTQAADGVDSMSDRLSASFRPDEVDPLLGKIRKLGAYGIFTGDQFVQAAQNLQKFGLDAGSNLEMVANLAAGTGQSLEATAQAIGFVSKGGSEAARAVKALASQFGISSKDLAEFGAQLDKNGKVLVETPAQADAARVALEALVSAKFSGAMENASGGMERFQGQLQLLIEDLGGPWLATQDAAAGAMVPLLKTLNQDMPDAIKAVIGVGVGLTGTLGNIAGSAVSMASQLGMLATGLQAVGVNVAGATVAVKAFGASALAAAGPIAAVTALVVAAVAPALLYADAVNKMVEAERELVNADAQFRQSGTSASTGEILAKTAQELNNMGVTAGTVRQRLIEVRRSLEETTDPAQRQRIIDQVKALREKATALSAIEDAAKKAASAERQAAAPAAKPETTTAAEDAAAKSKIEAKAQREAEAAAKKADRNAEAAEAKAAKDRAKADRDAEAAEKKKAREQEAEERKRDRERQAEERKADAEKQKAEREQEAAQKKAERDREAADKKAARDQEKAAVKQASDDAANAKRDQEIATRKGFDSTRPGGANSPMMSIEEAFSYGFKNPNGIAEANNAVMLGSQNRAQDPKERAGALGMALEAVKASAESLAPATDALTASAKEASSATQGLAAAAASAAESLRGVGGGSGGGAAAEPVGEKAGSSLGAAIGEAMGKPPESKSSPSGGGYPTTGYPGIPTKSAIPQSTIVRPVALPQSRSDQVMSVNNSRSQSTQVVNFNGVRVGADQDLETIQRGVEAYLTKRETRQRVMQGPWR